MLGFYSHDILEQEPSYSNNTIININSLPIGAKQLIDSHSSNIIKVKMLTVDTVTYKIKDIFIIDIVENEKIPVFCQISYILKINYIWIIIGKLIIHIQFISHLHAYEVEDNNEWIKFEPGMEKDHQPLDLYPYYENNNKLITLYHDCSL